MINFNIKLQKFKLSVNIIHTRKEVPKLIFDAALLLKLNTELYPPIVKYYLKNSFGFH